MMKQNAAAQLETVRWRKRFVRSSDATTTSEMNAMRDARTGGRSDLRRIIFRSSLRLAIRTDSEPLGPYPKMSWPFETRFGAEFSGRARKRDCRGGSSGGRNLNFANSLKSFQNLGHTPRVETNLSPKVTYTRRF